MVQVDKKRLMTVHMTLLKTISPLKMELDGVTKEVITESELTGITSVV